MPFKIKIVEVNVETVKQGKNSYSKASVVYSFNGQNRTQNIMSFSNPAVFAKVQNMKAGEEYSVEVTKNDKGYNQWASIEALGAEKETSASKGPARTSVSTYETPEERKIKQLYIIRQSSITNALTYLKDTSKEHEYGVSDVLNIAQEFVDFVYQQPDLFEQDNDLPTD